MVPPSRLAEAAKAIVIAAAHVGVIFFPAEWNTVWLALLLPATTFALVLTPPGARTAHKARVLLGATCVTGLLILFGALWPREGFMMNTGGLQLGGLAMLVILAPLIALAVAPIVAAVSASRHAWRLLRPPTAPPKSLRARATERRG